MDSCNHQFSIFKKMKLIEIDQDQLLGELKRIFIRHKKNWKLFYIIILHALVWKS